jgi:hypothetical protein
VYDKAFDFCGCLKNVSWTRINFIFRQNQENSQECSKSWNCGRNQAWRSYQYMKNESGFWSCSYQLFIRYQFVESVFSKAVNTVLVILLVLMLSKICHLVVVYECASVVWRSLFSSFFLLLLLFFKIWNYKPPHFTFFSMCLFYSSPVYHSCFPYLHLCGLIFLVISCNFICSINFHHDSFMFSVVL